MNNYLQPSSTSNISSKVINPSEENLIIRQYERPEVLIEFKDKSKQWKIISLALAVLCACLLTLSCVGTFLIFHGELNKLNIVKTGDDITCNDNNDGIDREILFKSPINHFSELTSSEIDSIAQFLHQQEFLELTHTKNARVNSNYIHLMEMLPPPKKHVLDFQAGKRGPPARWARVFIFRGNTSNPMVEEYKVGPLPNPRKVEIIVTKSRKTRIPFFMRPFSKNEFKAVFKHVLPVVMGKANNILLESYNATMNNCGNQCLKFTTTPISSGFLEKGKRKCWFWFTYDIEFYTLHPLDFQFLVDMSSTDPRNWQVERVFYANHLYSDLDDLVEKYYRGDIKKTKISFPDISDEEQYSAVYRRGNPIPSDFRPPPQQVQPDGPRYKMTGNKLEYMDWSFNIRVSPTVGTQLYDIRYRGDRIVYEMSMQEIGVLYSGYSPAASMLYFADSAGIFGTRMRGMMPGMDCPEHGTMLDALSYTSLYHGERKSENALCIFEHASETLLRRHRAYSMTGAFYSGLQDYNLVIRMYICIINYDYIFDFIFHNNGAIEVKVSSTGYLATSFYYPQEEPYGSRISENVIAGLHHHIFHFKVDVDIHGTENRFQTMNIGIENKTNPWADDTSRTHVQNVLVKKDSTTEKEASGNFDFEKPKYLLITKNEKSSLGHRPAYRIINKGMTHVQLPKDIGFEPSISWARQQLAITKQKDDEMTSSSMFAMWDAQDPVVKFDHFLQDDENIIDQDLVAWMTLGMYHIPHQENVPNTGTIGTTQSFFLTPFNYFREDPSIATRDAIKVMPRDPKRPLDGAIVTRHNMTFSLNCKTREIDAKIYEDSTFLFS